MKKPSKFFIPTIAVIVIAAIFSLVRYEITITEPLPIGTVAPSSMTEAPVIVKIRGLSDARAEDAYARGILVNIGSDKYQQVIVPPGCDGCVLITDYSNPLLFSWYKLPKVPIDVFSVNTSTDIVSMVGSFKIASSSVKK